MLDRTHFSKEERKFIIHLLRDTDLTMREIARRLQQPVSAIAQLDRKLSVRRHYPKAGAQ
jgi:hypothetical protein